MQLVTNPNICYIDSTYPVIIFNRWNISTKSKNNYDQLKKIIMYKLRWCGNITKSASQKT